MATYLKAGTSTLLSNFALGMAMSQEDFVAEQMFTQIPVIDLKGKYKAKLNKSMRAVDTRRKPGSPAVRISNDFEEKDYECIKHSAAVDVEEDDKIRATAAGIDIGEDATEDLMEGLMISREKELIDAITNVPAYAAVGRLKTLTAAEQWGKVGANIFANILEGKKAVGTGCGQRANTMFLRDDIADILYNSQEFRDRMFQLQLTEKSLGSLTIMLNKEKAGIDNIIITPAYYDKSAPKAGETRADSQLDFIAPPAVVIARVEKNVNIMKKTNTAFTYFAPESYDQLLIRSYIDEDTDTEVYKGDWYYGIQGSNYLAAFMINNVV